MTKGINPFSFSSLCPCMETAVWATFGCSVGCCWLVNYLEAQITGITPVFLLSSLIFTQPGEGEVTPVYRALLISVTRDQTWKPPPDTKLTLTMGKNRFWRCAVKRNNHIFLIILSLTHCHALPLLISTPHIQRSWVFPALAQTHWCSCSTQMLSALCWVNTN